MPITAVQLKTFFLCLLLSFSSTQVLLSQIPSCCRPESKNFQKATMSCHGVAAEADLEEDTSEDQQQQAATNGNGNKEKLWSKKATLCHCKPILMTLLGVKPFYADQAVLLVPEPESYEVPPHGRYFKSPTEVFMTVRTKPPISPLS